MKKNSSEVILLISAFFFLLSCTNNNNDNIRGVIERGRNLDFKNAILEIDRNLDTGWIVTTQVFDDSIFAKIYFNCDFYKTDAFKFLSEEDHSVQQIRICVYAMQKLDIDDYLQLCNLTAGQFEKGKIPEYVVESLILPLEFKKNSLIKNYDNPGVIQLLQRLKTSSKISNGLKSVIDEVLSGKFY